MWKMIGQIEGHSAHGNTGTGCGAIGTSDRGTGVSGDRVAGDDPVIFSLPNYGTWTVTGTLGDQTDTEVLEVDTAKRYNGSRQSVPEGG